MTLPNGIVVNYGYDQASELTGLTYSLAGNLLGNLTYAYDADGRRVQMGGSWARTGMPNPTTSTAVYNAANELTNWNGATLTYDGNGNLKSDGANTYGWNERNQLDSISGTTAASFEYGPFGRRLQKTVNGSTTDFLYDGVNPVQELSGGTVDANMLDGLGVDEYFQRADLLGTWDYLDDALGSTVSLADSTGAVQTQYTYDPFGGTTTQGAASANSFEYTGRENDGDGLYYYRERYYSPGLERFVSQDPIEYAGGPNLYAYVGGDPVVFIDPLGLCWIYKQSTGQMFHDSTNSVPVGTGYAGHGAGLKNPGFQTHGTYRSASVYDPANAGPLPQGKYVIGPQKNHWIDSGRVELKESMRLTQVSGDRFGRGGFFIHGDFQGDTHQMASKGCIVLPPGVRKTIGKSSDHCLRVVP